MAANDMVDHAARLEKMLKLIDNRDPYEMLGIDVSATKNLCPRLGFDGGSLDNRMPRLNIFWNNATA
jgi:hypothetical protein